MIDFSDVDAKFTENFLAFCAEEVFGLLFCKFFNNYTRFLLLLLTSWKVNAIIY